MEDAWKAPPMSARLVIAGTLECRDKDGKLLQTIEVRGAIPVDLTDKEEHGAAINEGA